MLCRFVTNVFGISTYANELGAAVAALGDGAALLEVLDTKVASRSLNDSCQVGGGVVAAQNVSFLWSSLQWLRHEISRIDRKWCISNR